MFLGRLGQKTSPIRISAIQSVLEFYEALQQALDETNTTCHDEYGRRQGWRSMCTLGEF